MVTAYNFTAACLPAGCLPPIGGCLPPVFLLYACRLPSCSLLAGCLLDACYLHSVCLPPARCPNAGAVPLACHIPSFLLPATCLPDGRLPVACRRAPAAFMPSVDRMPACSWLPPTNAYLMDAYHLNAGSLPYFRRLPSGRLPAFRLSAVYLPCTCLLPDGYLPPAFCLEASACRLPAACLAPTRRLNATCLLFSVA